MLLLSRLLRYGVLRLMVTLAGTIFPIYLLYKKAQYDESSSPKKPQAVGNIHLLLTEEEDMNNRTERHIGEAIINAHKKMFENITRYYEEHYDVGSDVYSRSKWPAIPMNSSSLQELICELKSLPSRSFDQQDAQTYGFTHPELYPNHSFLHGKKFKSCAIVGSSGGLLLSEAGSEIDSHEAVVRFNQAITEGYEKYVGNKTTLRIINSMVIQWKGKNIRNYKLFNKRETRLWFDVPFYNDLPEKWHSRTLMPAFIPTYLDCKTNDEKDEDFILHTDVLWGQYKALQKYADIELLKRPASSGFMGVALMMNYCEVLDLYGYIRTVNYTNQCYYWMKGNVIDCDLRSSHVLPTEKKIYLKLNLLDDYETFVKGKVRLLSFDNYDCEQI